MLSRLEQQLRDAAPGQVALLGLPYDINSSHLRGAAEAPPAIRRELFSDASNLWTEGGIDLAGEGLLFDAGDLGGASWDEADGAIEKAVSRLLEAGCHPLCLGGDHSVTFPIVRGLHRVLGQVDIFHVDAHPDLYDEFQGNPASHASPFARIMERGLAGRLVQAGIRALTGHQRRQADRFGVEIVPMARWSRALGQEFRRPVHISIDMDGLDPSAAPGVSHREPGGPTTRQVLEAIGTLRGKVVSADITEVNPSRDPTGMTASVAAKLVKEIAGRILASGGRPRPR